MERITFIGMVAVLMGVGLCSGQTQELQLTAGSSYIDFDYNMRKPTQSGYLRMGGGVALLDQKTKDYDLFHGTFSVGSEAWQPGLRTDLGFKAILGQSKRHQNKGDVGGVGFNVEVAYQIPEQNIPLPIEVTGAIAWVPSPLGFRDMDRYFSLNAGVDFQFTDNASILLAYHYRDFDMDDHWSMDSGVLSVGVSMAF